ncbi:MAG: hypothetical protein RB191_19720 [Terriglobia bacterium]|nr:hypothetical protein [Terriglobia bacterium]
MTITRRQAMKTTVLAGVALAASPWAMGQTSPSALLAAGDEYYVYQSALLGPFSRTISPGHAVQRPDWQRQKPERERQICFPRSRGQRVVTIDGKALRGAQLAGKKPLVSIHYAFYE